MIKKYMMPLYTCPDWNIRIGPMEPQMSDALYTTFAPLQVKRCVFVGEQRFSM